ncbi:MAG: hypothetical protein NTZ05_20065 [Chloroflexi bacterium]|nr:hypothetical protein [Chloroflexota bacterium]
MASPALNTPSPCTLTTRAGEHPPAVIQRPCERLRVAHAQPFADAVAWLAHAADFPGRIANVQQPPPGGCEPLRCAACSRFVAGGGEGYCPATSSNSVA